MKSFLYLACLLTATVLACGTQDDSTALTSFGGSTCKKEVNAAFHPSFLYTDLDAQDYPGLKCIAWKKTSSEALMIDLINFEGACGASWEGEASVNEPDALKLEVVNPGCEVASCGWCIYDWSFEVLATELSSDPSLAIEVNTCPTNPDAKDSFSADLPISSTNEGISCRYAHYYALEWQAGALGTCGTLHMPCSTDGKGLCLSAEGAAPCQGELVCEAAGEDPNQRICLQPCLEDGDCAASGLLSCQTGLCRLKSSW